MRHVGLLEILMLDRRRAWIWFESLVSLVAGLALVLNDSAAGWMLILLGIFSLGLLRRRGFRSAAGPRSTLPALVVAAGLGVMLVVIAALVLLRR
jgi:hypothetical protein